VIARHVRLARHHHTKLHVAPLDERVERDLCLADERQHADGTPVEREAPGLDVTEVEQVRHEAAHSVRRPPHDLRGFPRLAIGLEPLEQRARPEQRLIEQVS
jgi:hypothetical protein